MLKQPRSRPIVMEKINPINYFSSKRSPYYIYGFDYNEKSSGIRVLHLLCHILNTHGYESYIRSNVFNSELWTPQLTEEVMQKHYSRKRKPIIIYPESISGTPLGFGVKVRYLLNVPGFISGTTIFEDDELLFAYQDIFFGNTNCKDLLLIPASNPENFQSNNNNSVTRKGRYFYYNRLLERGGKIIPMPDGVQEISPYKPRELDELAEIFKSAELLFCYESSSIATEALLCGCPVVYLPNETMLPDFPKSPFGRDGAAWGDSPEEITRAKNTVHKVFPKYLELFDKFHEQFEKFIHITQESAKNISFENCFPLKAIKKWGWPIIGDSLVYRMQPGTKVVPEESKNSAYTQLEKLYLHDTEKFDCHITVAVSTKSKSKSKPITEATRLSLEQQIRKSNDVILIDSNDDFSLKNQNGWTLLLCDGDTLEPDALYILEKHIRKYHDRALLLGYFDHDEYCQDGSTHNPHFKSDFNYELLLSYPYISRSIFFRNDILRSAFAHPESSVDLALSYAIALKVFAISGASAFFHIPSLLGHLQPNPDPVFALTSDTWKSLAEVLQGHLHTTEPGATVLEGPGPGTFHVIPPLPETPLVSIIIPTRDQLPFLSRCIESLFDKTDYSNFEILIVDNNSQATDARQFLSGLTELKNEQIRVISDPRPFNFSRMNNLAVDAARGEFILMLNNDTAALQADWLTHMVRHALRKDVGIVGARLLYPDGRVQHAGILMGLRGPAEHPCLGLSATEPGYLFRAQVTQNFSAVTGACLLVKKSLYLEVGGLDEDTFGVSYNDVDFCLKVGKTGRRIVWTPLATLLHEGSASQKAGKQNFERFYKEQAGMYERWAKVIANDPAYNPNLTLVADGYQIETNSLLRFNKLEGLTPHRVVAFAADETGCGHYRVFQPMQAMSDVGLCTGGASPEMMGPNLILRSGADTLIFQRPYQDSDLDLLSSLLPLKGIKKVYELDDNITRVPIKSAHHGQFGKDLRGRVNKAIGLCDRLVVSTEPLAHELRGKNDDIRVVKNRLPARMWGEAPRIKQDSLDRPKGAKPKVGWAGGIGHAGDLEMIGDVIRSLSDQIDWVFFGMCPESLKPFVREFHVGVATLDYPERLMAISQTWDLAIAPLEINAFNECKSNLKLLEYGWCGVPVVCSDITPYQGNLPCRRVKNRFADWRNAILSMTVDPQACHQEGLKLQQAVETSWMLKAGNLQSWYEAWTD